MIPIEVKGERSGSNEVRSDRRKLSNARGQTYAEFALIVPCFLLLLFGIMWLGLAVYTYNYVSYSAREGSRYAAVHGTDSKQPVTTSAAVTTFVENDAPGLNPSNLTVSTTWTPAATPGNPGGTVQVQVQYQLQFTIPFMSHITLPLTSTSKMTIS